MKLSDAIRLGSLLKPQAFGQFYSRGGSCALGAACDAIGVDAEMNELISFETFCEPWEYAQLSNPYSLSIRSDYYVSPAAHAAIAIRDFVAEREETRQALWDSGHFVYGLS